MTDSLLQRGAKLDRYEVRELIGQGGMGEVYRAWDGIFQRDVALKILTVRDDDMLKRFKREAEVIGRLDNPNVVEVHAFSTGGEHPYIVMEYLRGESLKDRLRKGSMPVADAVSMALGVCHGVSACHSVGIIHRDLKPANVFLASTAHYGTVVKVLDFGVAKPASYRASDLTGPGKLVGTPRYIAPEQLRGAEADELSDQYGIGLLLHAALTGKPPFPGKQGKDLIQAILGSEYARPMDVRSDVPGQLDGVILRALRADRSGRFATVRDLGQALVPFAPAEEREGWIEYFGRDRGTQEWEAAASTAVMAKEDLDTLARQSIEDEPTKVQGATDDGRRTVGVVVPVAPMLEGPHAHSQTQIDSSIVPERRERTWTHAKGLIVTELRKARSSIARTRSDLVVRVLLLVAGAGLVAMAVLMLVAGHHARIETVSGPGTWTTVGLEDDQGAPPDGGLAGSVPAPSSGVPERAPRRHPTEEVPSAIGGGSGTVRRSPGGDHHPRRDSLRW